MLHSSIWWQRGWFFSYFLLLIGLNSSLSYFTIGQTSAGGKNQFRGLHSFKDRSVCALKIPFNCFLVNCSNKWIVKHTQLLRTASKVCLLFITRELGIYSSVKKMLSQKRIGILQQVSKPYHFYRTIWFWRVGKWVYILIRSILFLIKHSILFYFLY